MRLSIRESSINLIVGLLRCDPEELACLRIGAWSYHTALVKVMAQKYQDENSRDTGT